MIDVQVRLILVAMDLSPGSRQAWKQGKILARRFGAKVEGVHCLERVPPLLPLETDRQYERAARRAAAAKLHRWTGPGAAIRYVTGNPSVEILKCAVARRADLLVVGTRGRTGLARFVLGSVAESIIRASAIPVLAVRGRAREIRSILAPVVRQTYAVEGFATAARVAAALGAKLTALHVRTQDEPASDAFEGKIISWLPEDVRHACLPLADAARGEPAAQIVRAAAEHDLVIMVSHRRGVMKDWALGTTTERVLRRSPVPVLALPAWRFAKAPESGLLSQLSPLIPRPVGA